MTIVLQAEQADFVFEGFNLEISDTAYLTSTATYNYVDGNGNFYVNGNGDFYVTGSVGHYDQPIILDAHLPEFVFEGWIHNG